MDLSGTVLARNGPSRNQLFFLDVSACGEVIVHRVAY